MLLHIQHSIQTNRQTINIILKDLVSLTVLIVFITFRYNKKINNNSNKIIDECTSEVITLTVIS